MLGKYINLAKSNLKHIFSKTKIWKRTWLPYLQFSRGGPTSVGRPPSGAPRAGGQYWNTRKCYFCLNFFRENFKFLHFRPGNLIFSGIFEIFGIWVVRAASRPPGLAPSGPSLPWAAGFRWISLRIMKLCAFFRTLEGCRCIVVDVGGLWLTFNGFWCIFVVFLWFFGGFWWFPPLNQYPPLILCIFIALIGKKSSKCNFLGHHCTISDIWGHFWPESWGILSKSEKKIMIFRRFSGKFWFFLKKSIPPHWINTPPLNQYPPLIFGVN